VHQLDFKVVNVIAAQCNNEIYWTLYIYVNKYLRIRGYFSKPKELRKKKKSLRNTAISLAGLKNSVSFKEFKRIPVVPLRHLLLDYVNSTNSPLVLRKNTEANILKTTFVFSVVVIASYVTTSTVCTYTNTA